MRNIKPREISADEARELVLEYQQADDYRRDEIGKIIVEAYFKLVVKMASKFTSTKDKHYEDYLSSGCIAIANSMETYDGSTRFITYIHKPIFWYMQRYLIGKKDVVKNVPAISDDGEYNYFCLDLHDLSKYSTPTKSYNPTIEDLLKCPALTDVELEIIRMRLAGYTLSEVSTKYGFHIETIRKRWLKAVEKIKKYDDENY